MRQHCEELVLATVRLGQRLLDLLALGDVERSADVSEVFATFTELRQGVGLDPAPVAVAVSDPRGGPQPSALTSGRVDRVHVGARIVGVEQGEPAQVEQVVFGATEILEVGRIDVCESAVGIQSPDERRRRFGERAEPRFAATQCCLGLLELRDVDRDAADQHRGAVSARDRELAHDRVMYRSVRLLERFDRLHAGFAFKNPAIIRRELSRGFRGKNVRIRAPEKVPEGEGEGLLGRVIGVDVAALPVLDPRQTRKVVHELSEPEFAVLQVLLRAFPVGDVNQQVETADDPSVRVAQRSWIGHAGRARAVRPLDDYLFAPDCPSLPERDGHRTVGGSQRGPIGSIEAPAHTPAVRAQFRRPARQLNGGGVEVRDSSGGIGCVDCRRQRLQNLAHVVRTRVQSFARRSGLLIVASELQAIFIGLHRRKC